MKQWGKAIALTVLSVVIFGACTTYPNPGPTSPAYIGDGKTHAEFAQADAYCRDLAQARTGLTPGEAAGQSTAGSAIMGTLLGAALGAGIGAAAGDPGLGAAIGAGTGLAGGVAYGAGSGAASASLVQQRYDGEYHQCMYAAGHKVPGAMHAPHQRDFTPPPPPPPAPSSAPPSAPAPAPSAASAPAAPAMVPAACRPTGKYVKTPEGFKEICE